MTVTWNRNYLHCVKMNPSLESERSICYLSKSHSWSIYNKIMTQNYTVIAYHYFKSSLISGNQKLKLQLWIHPSYDVVVDAASHQRDITNNNKDRSIFLRAAYTLFVQSKSSPAPPPPVYIYIPSSIIIYGWIRTADETPLFSEYRGRSGVHQSASWEGGINCEFRLIIAGEHHIHQSGASSARVNYAARPRELVSAHSNGYYKVSLNLIQFSRNLIWEILLNKKKK